MWATSHVSRALFSALLHLFDARHLLPAPPRPRLRDHMIGEALIGLPLWLATRQPLLSTTPRPRLVPSARRRRSSTRASRRAASRPRSPLVSRSRTPFRFHSPSGSRSCSRPSCRFALCFWLRFVRTLRWRTGCCGSRAGAALAHGALPRALLRPHHDGARRLALVARPDRRAGRLRARHAARAARDGGRHRPTLWPYSRSVALRAPCHGGSTPGSPSSCPARGRSAPGSPAGTSAWDSAPASPCGCSRSSRRGWPPRARDRVRLAATSPASASRSRSSCPIRLQLAIPVSTWSATRTAPST